MTLEKDLLSEGYEKIDSCRSWMIDAFKEWLLIPEVTEGLDQVCAMTGKPAFIKVENGYLLHPIVTVMFSGSIERPQEFVKRLHEFGGFKVFES